MLAWKNRRRYSRKLRLLNLLSSKQETRKNQSILPRRTDEIQTSFQYPATGSAWRNGCCTTGKKIQTGHFPFTVSQTAQKDERKVRSKKLLDFQTPFTQPKAKGQKCVGASIPRLISWDSQTTICETLQRKVIPCHKAKSHMSLTKANASTTPLPPNKVSLHTYIVDIKPRRFLPFLFRLFDRESCRESWLIENESKALGMHLNELNQQQLLSVEILYKPSAKKAEGLVRDECSLLLVRFGCTTFHWPQSNLHLPVCIHSLAPARHWNYGHKARRWESVWANQQGNAEKKAPAFYSLSEDSSREKGKEKERAGEDGS